MEASSLLCCGRSCLLVWAASGETLDPGLPDRTMATCVVVLPHGGIVFGVGAGWRGSVAERLASTSSTMARLGHVAQQGLGDGRGLMDLRRTVALFDVMVALTTSLARSIPWSFLKMGSRRTATATSKVCAWVLAESLLDQVCS
jgi:predicted alpha/beta hydrolase